MDVLACDRPWRPAELLGRYGQIARLADLLLPSLGGDPADALGALCDALSAIPGYSYAWIGSLEPGREGGLIPLAAASSGPLPPRIPLRAGSLRDEASPSRAAAGLGRPSLSAELHGELRLLGAESRAAELRSCISLPLRAQGRVTGVLSLYADTESAFDHGELALLQDLADEIGALLVRPSVAKSNDAQASTAAAEDSAPALAELALQARAIAHEFNNLLYGIIGYTELAMTDHDSPVARETLGHVLETAQRASQTNGRLMELSRQAQQAASRSSSAAADDTPAVLIVDDEPALLNMAAQVLTRRGFAVTTAESAEAALALLADSGFACRVLVTDQSMGGMSGTELAAQAQLLRPGLPAILCTGLRSDADEPLPPGICAMLPKPVSGSVLAQAVRDVLGPAAQQWY